MHGTLGILRNGVGFPEDEQDGDAEKDERD